MDLSHHAVFSILGVPVTRTVITTWALVAVLSALAAFGGRHLRERPLGWQAVAEWGVQSLRGLIAETTGAQGDRYLPLVATLALFIAVANLVSVLPLMEAPTADLNTPLALAAIVFCSVHYFGVRELGLWGYVKKFAEPIPFLLPINLLDYVARTVSLAIRLFGNMVSHQIVVAVLLLLLPLVVPVLQLFGMFVGLLQAYIFVVLTVVYIGGAVQADQGGER